MAEAEDQGTLIASLVPQNPEQLLKDIESRTPVVAQTPEDDPKLREEYTFSVELEDGGKKLKGSFTNRILTLEDKMNVGLLRAGLAANTPFTALDPDTDWLIQQIAHMTKSLSKKPAWFSFTKIRSAAVIAAVYREVASHEATFHKPRSLAKEGTEGSKDDAGEAA